MRAVVHAIENHVERESTRLVWELRRQDLSADFLLVTHRGKNVSQLQWVFYYDKTEHKNLNGLVFLRKKKIVTKLDFYFLFNFNQFRLVVTRSLVGPPRTPC